MSLGTHSPTRPLIGITPRWEHKHGGVADFEKVSPEETIAFCFTEAIIAAGGMPVMLPLTEDEPVIDEAVAMCDGFAIPGGQDVDPAHWGVTGYDPTLLCPERDGYEFALVRKVLAEDKPLFTTCRGTQLLNVVCGGTLCMDVPSLGAPDGMTQWRHIGILTTPAHPVDVEPGSLLARCVGGARQIQVNSAHHCCVERLGEGVRLVGRATDGVPEAIELPDKRFVLGVQWHPEYTWKLLESEMGLWCSFVEACRS